MKKIAYAWLSIAFTLATLIFAAEFKSYPGSKVDEEATKDASKAAAAAGADLKATVYTTSDSFEKVALFYKGIGKEYLMPRASGTAGKPKKREGYDLWEAYFILDGANDLAGSKLWVKVQRPYVGMPSGANSAAVRDVTAIVVTQKK